MSESTAIAGTTGPVPMQPKPFDWLARYLQGLHTPRAEEPEGITQLLGQLGRLRHITTTVSPRPIAVVTAPDGGGGNASPPGPAGPWHALGAAFRAWLGLHLEEARRCGATEDHPRQRGDLLPDVRLHRLVLVVPGFRLR